MAKKITFTERAAVTLKSYKAVLLWPLVCKNWWLGVQSYRNIIPYDKKIVYKLCNGLRLNAFGHPGDLQIIREIFLHNSYSKLINFSEIKTIVDLGAHKGYFALQLAHEIGKEARILCVEPESTNLKQLKLNIQKNDLSSQITVEGCAVHTTDGYVTLYTAAFTPGNTIYKKLLAGKKRKVNVRCKPLKTLLDKHKFNRIDLLKLDIEGAEYEVIFNLKDDILDRVKYLAIECHEIEGYSISNMSSYLEDKGFRCQLPYGAETLVVCSRP